MTDKIKKKKESTEEAFDTGFTRRESELFRLAYTLGYIDAKNKYLEGE